MPPGVPSAECTGSLRAAPRTQLGPAGTPLQGSTPEEELGPGVPPRLPCILTPAVHTHKPCCKNSLPTAEVISRSDLFALCSFGQNFGQNSGQQVKAIAWDTVSRVSAGSNHPVRVHTTASSSSKARESGLAVQHQAPAGAAPQQMATHRWEWVGESASVQLHLLPL